VQLGALFAAGHSAQSLGDHTWPQLSLMIAGVQAYHLDLAARIASGKSPAMEAARSGQPAATGPDAAVVEQRTMNELGTFAEQSRKYGGTVGVATTAESPGGPDGFKLVGWLRGVAPHHRAAAMAAAMSGGVDLNAPVPDEWR
jgi:hypothetical protein